jgi:hypothetical protein
MARHRSGPCIRLAAGVVLAAGLAHSVGVAAGDPPLHISFPAGLPHPLPPGQPHQLSVFIEPGTQNVLPGSPAAHYRAGSAGPFTMLPLAPISGHEFRAMLPAFVCGEHVQLYFSAQGDQGATVLLPPQAPEAVFEVPVGVLIDQPLMVSSFQSAWPAGWWGTGLWHVTQSCTPPGQPCAPGPYAYCGRTSVCDYNIMNQSILTAPAIELPVVPAGSGITLRFCYALETESHPAFDKAEVFVNGQTRLEWRVPDVPSWAERQIDLSEYAGQTIELSWRFNTVNSVNNAFRGWHLANIRVRARVVGCEPCYANCDQSTTPPILNVEDFACFLNAFAQAAFLPHAQQVEHYANCDGSTAAPVLTVEDFACFMNRFAQGCE